MRKPACARFMVSYYMSTYNSGPVLPVHCFLEECAPTANGQETNEAAKMSAGKIQQKYAEQSTTHHITSHHHSDAVGCFRYYQLLHVKVGAACTRPRIPHPRCEQPYAPQIERGMYVHMGGVLLNITHVFVVVVVLVSLELALLSVSININIFLLAICMYVLLFVAVIRLVNKTRTPNT